MKRSALARLASLAALSISMLAACGGGGGEAAPSEASPIEAPPERTAYAVDDFVVGGTVRFTRLADGALLQQTVTGELGRFGWPVGMTGAVRIEVTGGFEDIDGLNATTADRRPFGGRLATLVDIGNARAPLVLSAVSTALADAAGSDLAAFASRAALLPPEMRQLLDLSDLAFGSQAMLQRLRDLSSLMRATGFDSTVAAVTADPTSAEFLNVRALAAQVGSTAPITRIADLALRDCVADALATDALQVTAPQLAGLTDLACARAGVVSLDGIDALPALRFLNVAGNDIGDPAPLRTLAQLEFADLADNRLRSIAALLDGAYTGLGLRVARNCIADLAETTGSARVEIATVDLHARQQYSSCGKLDADITALSATVADGVHVVLVRTTYNPAARCQLDWGDGTLQVAPCDARAVRYRHTYAGEVPPSVRFLVNGQVRRETTLPTWGPVVAEAGAGNDRDALIAPNGGEAWWNGQTQTVRWMTEFITGPSVDLFVLWDDPTGLENKFNPDIGLVINTKRWHRFAAAVANTGSYSVDPTVLSGIGNAYRVLVVATADRTKFDLSDANFSLNLEAQPPPQAPVVQSLQCDGTVVGEPIECVATGTGLVGVSVSFVGQSIEWLSFSASDTRVTFGFRSLNAGNLRVSLHPGQSTGTLASLILTIVGGALAPATPAANAPGTTSTNGPLLGDGALFNWSASEGATTYEVSIFDRTLGVRISVRSYVDTATSFLLGDVGLPPGGAYQWTVAACNAAGCSAPTPPLNFRTP